MIMMFKKYLYLHKGRRNIENENVMLGLWPIFLFHSDSITVYAIHI